MSQPASTSVRVASLQYWIRPVQRFEDFVAQVRGLVETAADYGARLLVFPEYFTIQLLTLNDVRRPLTRQVRDLARLAPRIVQTMADLARANGLFIVAGSMPTADPDDGEMLYNDAYLFSPEGECDFQGKMHMTRWESEDWLVSPRDHLKLFETDFGKLAINICYDVEFPELARAAARQGATLLVVPSCTDERQGFLRVRYCAQARAIENSMYVVHASTVGSLPMVAGVSLNYGQASILTPSDFAFSRDGIIAEGVVNQETMVIADLNLASVAHARTDATVLPLRDSERTESVVAASELVPL
jgi:predicted amidohydrolase